MDKTRLLKIIDNSVDVIAAVNPDGSLIYMNKEGLKLLKWSSDDLVGKNMVQAYPDWIKKLLFETAFPEAAKNKFWEGETLFISSTGDEIPVSQIIIAHFKDENQSNKNKQLYDPISRVDFFSTIIRNTNNFKSFSKSMLEREKKYRLLTENSIDVIWQTDLNLNFTYVSPSVKLLLDYTPQEVIKIGSVNTLTPESLEKVNKIFTEEIKKEFESLGQAGIRVFELDQIKKDGTIVNTEVITNFIRDNSGIIFAVSGRTRNITQRKKAEKILENANQQLEEMVQLKTGELLKANKLLEKQIKENKKLAKKQAKLQKELARADKLKTLGLLAGTVAHDLNNTLSVTSGYSDLLLNLLSDKKELLKPLTNIKTASLKAADLVDDLLTLTRRNTFSKEIVDLNIIINEFIESIAFQKLNKLHSDTIFLINLQDGLYPISGSKTHIYKMILNLIINAYEAFASLKNDAKIELTTRNMYIDDIKSKKIISFLKEKENFSGYITQLRISDNGSGIKKTDYKKIFEPFFTTKKEGKSGTGLGMSIVFGTIKDHSAYIDIESEKNKGTDFIVYFNSSKGEIFKNEEYLEPDLLKLSGNRQNVLIIEDQVPQGEMVKIILEELNYNVSLVTDIKNAVTAVKSRDYNLVILDMLLSDDTTGFDCYKEIKKIVPKQKAIIMSGFSKNENVLKTQNLGAGFFLRKPFTIKKLAQAVKEEMLDEKK